MPDQTQAPVASRAAALSASDRVAVLRVARAAIDSVDPRELAPFDRAGQSVLAARPSLRSDPGGFNSAEVMNSVTGGAVAAAGALVQLAVVGFGVKTWQWFAARIAERRTPLDSERSDAVPAQVDGAELFHELVRIRRVAYEATEPFLSDEKERWRVADAALAAYVQERLAAVDAPRS
jgi:hypothetical protein